MNNTDTDIATYQENLVHNTAAVDLAPCVARSSAAMV